MCIGIVFEVIWMNQIVASALQQLVVTVAEEQLASRVHRHWRQVHLVFTLERVLAWWHVAGVDGSERTAHGEKAKRWLAGFVL